MMPACRIKSRGWRDLRNHKNGRSRWLKKTNAGLRACPNQAITEKMLPISVGRVRFYNYYLCDLLDFGTQYREASR